MLENIKNQIILSGNSKLLSKLSNKMKRTLKIGIYLVFLLRYSLRTVMRQSVLTWKKSESNTL